MINFVGKKYWYFLVSALIIIPGVLSLLIPIPSVASPMFPPGLRWGLDFTGGSAITIEFSGKVDKVALEEVFTSLGHGDAVIRGYGEKSFFVTTRALKEEEKDSEGKVIRPSEDFEIKSALEERFGALGSFNADFVHPAVAAETVRNSIFAVIAASVGILLYITWAFRKMPKPFRWGVCAVITLVHDVLVVLGLFSLLGRVMNLEVNVMFVTAALTIIGFSVHDTIVVFDRIRENILKGAAGQSLAATINASILQTLGRSLNTSLTVLFTLLALLLFGGASIRNFVLAMTIGIITGTYSSIAIASQLLVVWERNEIGSFFKQVRLRFAPSRGGTGA
ncbi:MAG: protein translocase subunit SecF [Chloroflexi bacterium]|nr:protein translocase subunit SecF [Chloroflexota bacterium]